jgi:hypothetical protein
VARFPRFVSTRRTANVIDHAPFRNRDGVPRTAAKADDSYQACLAQQESIVLDSQGYALDLENEWIGTIPY